MNLGFPTFFLFFQAEQQITPCGVIGVLTTKDEGQGGDEDCDFFVICYLIWESNVVQGNDSLHLSV